MPAQIPARQSAGVREQGIHASLGLRRIENELSFSVLLQDGIVMIHRHRTIRVPVRRNSNPEDGEIQAKRQDRRAQQTEHGSEENSPQSIPQIGR
jgi:hypothetical protein